MTEKIGNFYIVDTADNLIFHYTKTAKDWFDIFFWMSTGGICAFMTYFFLLGSLEGPNYYFLFIPFIFLLVAIMNLTFGFQMLSKPTKEILKVDKNAGIIILKKTIFKSITFSTDEIRTFVLERHTEPYTFDGNRFTRIYCLVKAKLRNGKEINFFIINNPNIWKTLDQIEEKEIHLIAKKLKKKLDPFKNK